MSVLDLLVHLQELDSEIQSKKQRLGEILRAQKESDSLLKVRAEMTLADSEHQKWQTNQKNLSLELEGLNAKIQKSEETLYSGTIKNTKELSDLQAEIESLGRRRRALEDEMLEVMVQLEGALTKKTAVSETLHQMESEWQKSTASLKKEQNELALKLHTLIDGRQKQASTIPPSALADYSSINQKKGGTAVARLRSNMCLGCRLTVSANVVKDVREGKIAYCGSCGRILAPA